MKVKEGRTELTVPHGSGKCIFIYPYVKGNLKQCASQISEMNLKRPTSAQTASLVYDSWKNPHGKYEEKIISILKGYWLWEFTGNLYLPKSRGDYQKGVILWDLEFDKQGEIRASKESLIKRLEEGDKTVRFVPFGFKIGKLDISEIPEHAYFIARYGREGAEKIAKTAENYANKPELESFESVNEEIIRVSALNENASRLYVNCEEFGDRSVGRALGVL